MFFGKSISCSLSNIVEVLIKQNVVLIPINITVDVEELFLCRCETGCNEMCTSLDCRYLVEPLRTKFPRILSTGRRDGLDFNQTMYIVRTALIAMAKNINKGP